MIERLNRLVSHAGSAAMVLVLVSAAGAAPASDDARHGSKRAHFATADIIGCRGEGRIGRALLVEEPSDQGVKTVVIRMLVKGLTPGEHAVHIHEKAVCEPCGAAGGHFDPGPNANSSPDGNHPFHMGDLENITVRRKGRGYQKVLTTRVTLSPGPLSLFDDDGSAFIIHDSEDTFCPDGKVTGCAGGSRAACGIIKEL